MAKDFHSDPLFQVLKEYFKVNLFYKPSMTGIDVYYHVVLDNIVNIQFRLIAKNFLILDSIIPLTTEYIPKTYMDLVKCLKEQEMFSVMIFRLGNTAVIDDACKKTNIPIVVDEKFITIPKKLYNMYLRLYSKDTDRCGFYLLSLKESTVEFIDIKEEKKGITPLENKRVEDTHVNELPVKGNNVGDYIEKIICTMRTAVPGIKINSDYTNTKGSAEYKGIEFDFTLNDICMSIVNVRSSMSNISGVVYMELFESLENMLSVVRIEIPDVTNKAVYYVCQARAYEKMIMMKNRRGYGSYSMRKLK